MKLQNAIVFFAGYQLALPFTDWTKYSSFWNSDDSYQPATFSGYKLLPNRIDYDQDWANYGNGKDQNDMISQLKKVTTGEKEYSDEKYNEDDDDDDEEGFFGKWLGSKKSKDSNNIHVDLNNKHDRKKYMKQNSDGSTSISVGNTVNNKLID